MNEYGNDTCSCAADAPCEHESICAVHNEPAEPNGNCNCKAAVDALVNVVGDLRVTNARSKEWDELYKEFKHCELRVSEAMRLGSTLAKATTV